MASSEPRFRLGFIAPPAVGAEQALRINEEQLLPPDVVRISVGLGISDYTTAGVEEAIGRYWSLVDELAAKGANYIILAGVPISSQLGRERVLRLLEETKRRTGITADSTNEAMIAAMQHLRVDRMTVASRWAAELNRRLTEYFGEAGIKVEAITSEGQWAKEAFAMSVEKGFVLAMRLGRVRINRSSLCIGCPARACKSAGSGPQGPEGGLGAGVGTAGSGGKIRGQTRNLHHDGHRVPQGHRGLRRCLPGDHAGAD